MLAEDLARVLLAKAEHSGLLDEVEHLGIAAEAVDGP